MLQPILAILPWLELYLRSRLPAADGPAVRRGRPLFRSPGSDRKDGRP